MSLRSRRAMLPKSTSASTTTRPATMCSPPANRSSEVTSARRALTELTTRRLNSSLTSAVIATRRHPSVRCDPVHLRRLCFLRSPPRRSTSQTASDPCRARSPRPAPRPACPGHVKVYQVGPRQRTEPGHRSRVAVRRSCSRSRSLGTRSASMIMSCTVKPGACWASTCR